MLFVQTHELKMTFTFLNDWGKKQKEYFTTFENDVKFKFQFIHLCFVSAAAVLK